MEGKDPFRDLAFDGKPSNYREFRRKVILSVAALEDKSQHLAGPKLLSRLTGEAWRCTEHLSVSELRTSHGWTKVLECLDKHYQHLPEIELHEAIDEFLFHLKKRPHEGATAFSSRFRTQLARLEHLITQERAAAQVKRRKIQPDGKRHLGPATPVASSLEDSSDDKGDKDEEEADKTDGGDETEEPKQAPEAEQSGPFDPPISPRHSSKTPSEKPSSRGSKRQTAGTWKADQERSLLEMQRVLGTLEPSHRKPKPIFPQSVLGHLFMRKFEQGTTSHDHQIHRRVITIFGR